MYIRTPRSYARATFCASPLLSYWQARLARLGDCPNSSRPVSGVRDAQEQRPSACDTPQKQKKAATHYMNGVVKVPVEVDIGDRTVRAMLVSRPLRSRPSRSLNR